MGRRGVHPVPSWAGGREGKRGGENRVNARKPLKGAVRAWVRQTRGCRKRRKVTPNRPGVCAASVYAIRDGIRCVAAEEQAPRDCEGAPREPPRRCRWPLWQGSRAVPQSNGTNREVPAALPPGAPPRSEPSGPRSYRRDEWDFRPRRAELRPRGRAEADPVSVAVDRDGATATGPRRGIFVRRLDRYPTFAFDAGNERTLASGYRTAFTRNEAEPAVANGPQGRPGVWARRGASAPQPSKGKRSGFASPTGTGDGRSTPPIATRFRTPRRPRSRVREPRR
jgi:hypothetical protein